MTENNAPLVSVIIPAYNAGQTIRACLEGVLTSDYPSFEVIVVDDGSTDGTAAAAGEFKPLRLVAKENGGSASAKNLGARQARGEMLYFLDADVVVFPDTISLLADTLEEHGVDLVMGRYSRDPMNEGLIHHYKAMSDYVYIVPRKLKNTVYINGQIGGGGDFYSRRAFEHAGGYDEAIKGAGVEREDLWLRFYDLGYRSAANPLIRTRHYFPDFLATAGNYWSRILGTLRLLEGRPATLTYMRKANFIGPALSAWSSLGLAAAAALIDGERGWLLAASAAAALSYGLFSREFLFETLQRKGLSMTLKLVPLHLFFMSLICVSGALAMARVGLAAAQSAHDQRS